MTAAAPRPLVGLPADSGRGDDLPFHRIGDKYVRAVALAARAVPVAIPALGDTLDVPALLDALDGLVLTGATSNVHPPRYGDAPSADHEPYDLPRDGLALALVRAAIERGVPMLCICRGLQELNVALGGTLEGEIQRADGRIDHRAPDVPQPALRYAPRHDVTLAPDGLLASVVGATRMRVNSLHRQSIAALAPGLRVEACAPDGVIEAVSMPGASAFVLGVQWHPEYEVLSDPGSMRIFEAFGDAARARRRLRAPH